MTDDKVEIKRIFRREEKQERKALKKEERSFERKSTARLQIKKGQWQFGAAAMHVDDAGRFPSVMGIVPYKFYLAAKSQTTFSHNFKKASQLLGSDVFFGVMVGGVPMVLNEKTGLYVQQRKKPTRKFYMREPVCTENCRHFNVLVNESSQFETVTSKGFVLKPGEKIRVLNNILTTGDDYDKEIVVKSRAVAYCVSNYAQGAKSVCFGLVPYDKIECCDDVEAFDEYYKKAFDSMGEKLGKVQYGWIVEIYQKKGVKIEVFSVLEEGVGGETTVRFYDFKSPVDKKLNRYLESKIDMKRNGWKNKAKKVNQQGLRQDETIDA